MLNRSAGGNRTGNPFGKLGKSFRVRRALQLRRRQIASRLGGPGRQTHRAPPQKDYIIPTPSAEVRAGALSSSTNTPSKEARTLALDKEDRCPVPAPVVSAPSATTAAPRCCSAS
ncbi:hypothetical protein SCALM49S_07065 [Streptomyces californicus]